MSQNMYMKHKPFALNFYFQSPCYKSDFSIKSIHYAIEDLCLSIMQSQGNFSNVGNWVTWVITCLHIAWILQILHLSKPFIMIGHVIWCTRINIPYIILCPLFCDGIHHMLHNKQMLFSVFILSFEAVSVPLCLLTKSHYNLRFLLCPASGTFAGTIQEK